MNNRTWLTTAATVAALAGCMPGDDTEGCDPYFLNFAAPAKGCLAAQTAAMMDAPNLLVQPADIARYFARLQRAIAAEPFVVQASYVQRFSPRHLVTTNAAIAHTWQATRSLALGNEVDQILQEAGLAFFDDEHRDPNNLPYMVTCHPVRLYNPYVLNARLAPYGIAVWEPTEWIGVNHSEEGTFFHWPTEAGPTGNDTATVTIDIDIPTGQFPPYKFRAIVSPSSADVFYLSDNLPQETLDYLAPTTRRWPQ